MLVGGLNRRRSSRLRDFLPPLSASGRKYAAAIQSRATGNYIYELVELFNDH